MLKVQVCLAVCIVYHLSNLLIGSFCPLAGIGCSTLVGCLVGLSQQWFLVGNGFGGFLLVGKPGLFPGGSLYFI